MALENEFRPKQEPVEEKPTAKRTRYTTGDVEENDPPKKERTKVKVAVPVKGLAARFDKKRTKTIVGILLVLLSFFAFFSCISYFFTWTADQDRVLDKSLFTFLFENDPEPVANWLGKFGAWTSHLLMFRWFGVSSLGIAFCIFLIGFRWMLNIRLLPIKRSLAVSSLFMVWTSLFLAYFVEKIDYLGGTFGFTVVSWIKLSVGSFGAFVAILGLLVIVLVVLFNLDLNNLVKNAAQRAMTEDEEVSETEPAAPFVGDIHVVNTIKDEQIQPEFTSETVHFDEDEEEEYED